VDHSRNPESRSVRIKEAGGGKRETAKESPGTFCASGPKGAKQLLSTMELPTTKGKKPDTEGGSREKGKISKKQQKNDRAYPQKTTRANKPHATLRGTILGLHDRTGRAAQFLGSYLCQRKKQQQRRDDSLLDVS